MKQTITTGISAQTNYDEIFPDEETFQKIFSECLETKAAPPSEAINCYYHQMADLFVKYLEATQENMFRYAYQCGFMAALKADAHPNY